MPRQRSNVRPRQASASTEIFEAIVERIPPPTGDPAAPLQALIFDANYDPFRGTVISCRVFDGTIKAGDIIRFMSNGATYKVEEVGVFRLKLEKRKQLCRPARSAISSRASRP